jgi:hypothetical protein
MRPDIHHLRNFSSELSAQSEGKFSTAMSIPDGHAIAAAMVYYA